MNLNYDFNLPYQVDKNTQPIDYNLHSLSKDHNYYDVKYVSPTGNIGDMICVNGNSVHEVSIRAPVMLCYGTNWTPDEFIILSIKPTDINNLPHEITGEEPLKNGTNEGIFMKIKRRLFK